MAARRRYILPIIGTALVAVLALIWLAFPRPSAVEAAFRFLPPDCLFAVHLNLAGLRDNPLVREALMTQAPPDLEKDYGDFIRATGFNFERDVRSVAIGISGPEGARLVDAIVEGGFDRGRLDPYITAHRRSTSLYNGGNIDVFEGPSGRKFRLAFLGRRMLAFSNASDPTRMQTMMRLAGGGGDSLDDRLRQLNVFEHVSSGSQLWVSADLERGARVHLPASPGSDTSFTSDLLKGSRMVMVSASLRGQDAELLLMAQYASRGEAETAVESLSGLRALLRALASREARKGAAGADFARALDAISIAADKNAAVVRWPVDPALLQYLLRGK